MAKKENKMSGWKLPYEKQITSQHGEDGIIEVMLDAINVHRDKTFLEIGWGDGGTNMTWHLMVQQGWSGVGVDAQAPKKGYDKFPPNFKHYQEFVYPNTCTKYLKDVPLDCDFFSLDIDSFDYEVAKTLLHAGFRPKTVCVEINKFFGANHHGSFPYMERVKGKIYHKLHYSGVSLQKYKKLWEHYGYAYFGYDSSLTNAFFYRKDCCNDLSHVELLPLDDFPYQDDSVMKDTVSKLPNWNARRDEIFSEDMNP